MRALRGLTASDIQPRQLTLQWEPLGYNLTRCHTYTLSLCYRYSVPAGGSGGNNATVRECLSVDRNTSRFTLRDLPPFHSVHVRLALSNPEGKKESREVTFQTEEDSESPGFLRERRASRDATLTIFLASRDVTLSSSKVEAC